MTESAVNTFKEVDVIFFLVDGGPNKGPGDKYIIQMLQEVKTPKILVINKIDKLTPEEFKETYDAYSQIGIFDGIYGTSALESKNIDVLCRAAEDLLSPGPMYFPEDMVTDHPERFIVSEIIREKNTSLSQRRSASRSGCRDREIQRRREPDPNRGRHIL